MTAGTAELYARPWKQLANVIVELGTGASFNPSGSVWGTARWHQTTWEPSYEPTWSDITGDTLTLSTSPARSSVFDTAAAASLSFSLWNDRGQWAPEEHEWFMGRLVRVTARVQGRAPVPLFYGQIQTASYGGTPQIPTIDLTALDVLAMIGAPDGGVPAAPDEERVDLRISRLLAAMNWPASRADIRPDSVLLLPDTDTRYLDVMSRAAESAGGLLTADAAGIVHYRDRYWLDGFRQLPVVYAVAVGAPPAGLDPGVPVATPSAQTAGEVMTDIENQVTYANNGDETTGVSVTTLDQVSIERYGYRPNRSTASDLGTVDQATLTALAQRHLDFTAQIRPTASPTVVTVFDHTSALAIERVAGERVNVSWNADGGPYEIDGLVLGVGHSIDARRWDVAIYVATMLAVGETLPISEWGGGVWGASTWQPLPHTQEA